MDYTTVLSYLYPGITFLPISGDCRIVVDGFGNTTIQNWNTAKLGTQPTLTQLEAAWGAAQLAQARASQTTLLRGNCDAAITGGFVSSALGAAHTYPSTLIDQHNLASSVVASLLPNLPSGWTTKFWVMDSTGAWSLAPHTAAQIQQAGLDGKAWVTAQQEKLASLNAQIDAATTVSAVQAIIW